MKELALDAFMQYQFLSELNFSPDGKQAALTATQCDREKNTYRSVLWLYREGAWKQLTAAGKEKNYLWEDETHILFPAVRSAEEKKRQEAGEQFTAYYRISTEGGEAEPAFTIPVRVKELKAISQDLWLVLGALDCNYPDYYAMSEEEREAVAKAYRDNADYEVFTEIPFWANNVGVTDKKRSALFLYDSANDIMKRITGRFADVAASVILGDRIFYVSAEDDRVLNHGKNLLAVYDMKKGETGKISLRENFTITNLQKLGEKLLITGFTPIPFDNNPDADFYTVDPGTGVMTLLLANEDSLGNSTGSDCRYGKVRAMKSCGDRLYYLKTIRNSSHLYCLKADGTEQALISREGAVDDFDVTEDGKICYTGMYGTDLQEIYLKEAADAEAVKISSFNAAVLADTYRSGYQKLSVRSHGWEIDGWVLLPKDYDEQQTYPAILDIHGGPRTAYGEIFNHEMQVWANRGYFVFFCNPVGSSGRGYDFSHLTGQYGQIDFFNIMDFTDAVLKAYPQIDPKRLGATGGSYGGFMCNWMMGHTDRFACYATQRSISNWITMEGIADIGFTFDKTQTGGDIYTEEGLQRMWDQSPLKAVNEMHTPTLFIHSEEDHRCPPPEGMQLFTALTEKGVPTRFVFFKGENHELSRSGKPLHRARRLQEITDWMDQYLKE